MEMNGVAGQGRAVGWSPWGQAVGAYTCTRSPRGVGAEWGGVERNVRPLETRLSTDEAPAGKTGPCQSGRGADWPVWKLSRRG